MFDVGVRNPIIENPKIWRLPNVELQRFDVYLPYGRRLNLENTLLDGQMQFVLRHQDGKTAEHYLNGNLKIGGLGVLSAPASPPVLQIAGLSARDIHLDLLNNRAVVSGLTIQEPHLLVTRDSTGLNLVQLFTERGAMPEKPAENGAEIGPMPVTIQQAETSNGTIEFVDQTVNPTVKTAFQDVILAAKDVDILPKFAVAQVTAEGQLGEGSVQMSGGFGDQDSTGHLTLTGIRLPFQPYSGYLNQLFNSAKSSGDTIHGKLKLAFGPAKNGEIVTSINGSLEGHDLTLGFPDKQNPFLKTERLGLDLRTIRLGSNPRVDIDQIKFVGANLWILRNKEGSLNLSRLWASDGQKVSASKGQAEIENRSETTMAIRSITVEKSNIAIEDRSVSPNYETTLSQVNGKLSDLLPGATRAELKLQGIMGDTAKLTLAGWFVPFAEKPQMHLEGTIRSYALPPLNPYATKYVSHRIQRGEITTDVKYTLSGDEIEATTDLVLRGLRVGEKTGDEFISRIGIPLELAVALLQDIHGVIRLQVAMSGDTGPELNVTALIWRAVRNAIVRAITAPFRWVGNILTLGGRIGAIQIDPIFFQPGTREIQPKSAKQLAQLAELLQEKPRIELKLKGRVSRGELDAIKKKGFWEQIQTVEAEGYEDALVRLYKNMGGITDPKIPLPPIVEESLERFVLERIAISEDQLHELARERAEIIKQELQNRGVDPERLSVTAAQDLAKGEKPAVEIEIVS